MKKKTKFNLRHTYSEEKNSTGDSFGVAEAIFYY